MKKYYVKLIWCIPLLVIVGLSLSSTLVAAKTVEGNYGSENSILQQSTGFPEVLPTNTPPNSPTATLPFAGTKVVFPSASITPSPSIGGTNNPYPSPEMIYGTETPLPNLSTYNSKASFSFKDIQQPELSLRYPTIFQMGINFPDRWLISPSGSYMEIHYSLAENWGSRLVKKNEDIFTSELNRPYIEIRFNGYLAGMFYPEVGNNQVAFVKLPYNFASSRSWNTNNDYNIEFDYTYGGNNNAGTTFYCDYNGILTIHDTSTFNIAFKTVSPALTLAEFPRVLIQNSFIPETLYFVIPDVYNEKDLTTVAQISMAIGKSAPGANLDIKIITASQVSPDLILKSSVIILGEPSRNTFLTNLYAKNTFTTKLTQDNKQIAGIGVDEGLLQLAQPNENKAFVYLVVTGNSETGVSHAANSLLYPPVGLSGTYFVARSIYTPKPETTPPPIVYALSDFGYTERVFYAGVNRRSFSFYIPRNWSLQDGVKLIFTYAHANNISYANSGITVLLNNSPIGSIPLLPQNIGEVQYTINLPKESIIPGAMNNIRFEVSVTPELNDCSRYNPRVAWITIRDSSLINLPYKIITDPNEYAVLHDPIFYLMNDPNYIAILPEKPQIEEIRGIANVSKIIGSLTTQYNVNVMVRTNAKIGPDALKNSNVLLIGKPSRNSLIQTINTSLPQPFVPGEDSLTLQQKIGSYRIEQSIGTGIVQSITSPWNESKNITVISGTNDDGLKWALEKISNNTTINDFLGELNFVQADRVQSFQSKIPPFLSPEKVISDITGQGASLQPVPTIQEQPVTGASAQPSGETNTDQYISTKQTTPTVRFGSYAINGYYIILGIIVIALIIATISITSTVRGGRKR